MISVVVPVYNSEKYLHKCVKSILNQTYSDLELILVDDGSSDNCPQICDEYAKQDKRVNVIHKENGGVSTARNAGLEVAKGDFITFVDSDDYLDPVAYQKMMEIADEYKCDLVVCDCIKDFSDHSEVYTHNVRGGFYDAVQMKEEYYPQLLVTNEIEYPITISNGVCLFRASVCNAPALKYIEGVRYSEDWLFGAQVALRARTMYYMKGQAYYHYVMNDQSATHKFVPDKWNDYQLLHKSIKERFSKCKEYDFSEQIDLCLLFLVYNIVGYFFSSSVLTRKEKMKNVKAILKQSDVVETLKRINIGKLNISYKQKIITYVYKYRMGLNLLAMYRS